MRDFHMPGRSAVYAANGICATSHPLAAKVAISMLEEGGNAVDAAISAALVLGICEPQMTGIGGDCFALVHMPGDDRIIGLNGSGRAPAGIDAEALRAAGHRTMPEYQSGASVTVPGALDAMLRLNERHGTRDIGAVLAPAIHYADAGVPVAPRVAFDWADAAPGLAGDAARFYLLNGSAPRAGQVFRAPGQAEILRRVATHGRDAFYQGEVAEDMAAALRAAGGTHQTEDFAATSADWVAPISGSYGDYDLIELPPNGQGATAILMANILAEFDVDAMDPFGADRAHLEAEAAKLAYDARNRFIAENSPRLDHMLSPKTARDLAALIDMTRAMPSATTISEAVHKDTIYITVVDRDRMAVSLIYSIFHGFGSRISSRKFGVLLQNRGAGFSLEPGHPNEAAPGKRPMHTIIPGMLRHKGRLAMPFGVMGGAYQPNGHARFLTNLADFGLDPQAAIDAPRSFAGDGEMQVERGYSDAVRADLAGRGHNVVIPNGPLGGAQAIWIGEDGILCGASDPRKDGIALGY